jgi:hypothetical protein
VKCGAELRSEQKVCIVCGTRTAAGGHFHVEEKQAWKPTAIHIYAASAVAVVLIILLITHIFSTVPPEVVAKEWFDAMSQRSCRQAEKYHSPEFISKMQSGISDTQAISDYIFDEVVNNQAVYTVGVPSFPSPGRANVLVTLKYPDGHVNEVPVDLTKSGRRWLIANVAY